MKRTLVNLTAAISMMVAATVMAPSANAQTSLDSDMKKEIKMETRLATQQYYNVNAPYLDPEIAPTPGVVNALMRIAP